MRCYTDVSVIQWKLRRVFPCCSLSGEGLHVSYIIGGLLSILFILLLIASLIIYR